MKDNTPKSFSQISQQMRHHFIHIFSYISIFLTAVFGMNPTGEIHPIIANLELFVAFVLILNLFILRRTNNLKYASSIILLTLGILLLSIYTQGGISQTGNLWIMAFPLLSFYLKDNRESFYWIGFFTTILLAINILMILGYIPLAYEKSVLRQTFVVYIVITLLSYFHNRIKSVSQTQIVTAEENISAILENMQDTYFRTQMDSSIVMISPSVKQLSGYSEEEVLGTNMLEYYLDPDVRVDFLDQLNRNQGRVTNFQLRFRHKQQKTLWTLVNAQYIYDEDNIVVGIEGTAKDITTLKETQMALEELNNHLESRINKGIDEIRQRDAMLLQQARMAQMGEMLSMIAHQWRQPLSSVAAISSNLKLSLTLEETISNEELDTAIDKIDNHIAFLSSTIDDFKNFFRTDQEAKPTQLHTIMMKALEILHPAIVNNNINLNKSCETHKSFDSFESELIQVAINIVNNAIDILKERPEPREIYIHGYEEEENSLVLTISDNAGGINETILPNIFDPYFSTKSEKNGTGLGLYMSKTIVEEHCHGKLKAQNLENGVCFTISLPLTPSKT